jgi:hypothetical protein
MYVAIYSSMHFPNVVKKIDLYDSVKCTSFLNSCNCNLVVQLIPKIDSLVHYNKLQVFTPIMKGRRTSRTYQAS